MVHIKKNKHYFLLLEVIIAFALVAMCTLPLVYPLVSVVKVQKNFLNRIELDLAVSNMYGELLIKLYQNEIQWSSIQQKEIFPVSEEMWDQAGYPDPLPFEGYYQLSFLKQKAEKKGDLSASFVKLKLEFTDKTSNKQLVYEYKICILKKNLGNVPLDEEED